MQLSEGEIGKAYRIKKVSGKGSLRRRLMEMGFTPGATLKLVKVAPLGDPVQIKLRNYEISLRKNECENITVEPI